MSISCKRQEKTQGPLIKYEYSYSGAMSRSGSYYKVERDQDGLVRVSYSSEGKWGQVKVYRGPGDALEVIDKMVMDGGLKNLRPDYKCVGHVLDGWSWNIYIRYEQGSISSGGYMAKPSDGLQAAIKGINDYILSLAVEENYLETVDLYP